MCLRVVFSSILGEFQHIFENLLKYVQKILLVCGKCFKVLYICQIELILPMKVPN